MNTVRYCIIGLLPVLQTALFVVGLVFPAIYFYVIVAGIIITDALLTFFFQRALSRWRIFWYALPSLLLYVAVSGSLLVLEEHYMIVALVAANSALQLLYLIHLHGMQRGVEQEQNRAFWYSTMSLHVLSFFCFAVTFYGLIYYADYNIFVLLIPIGIISACSFAQQLVSMGVHPWMQWKYWTIQTLIIMESALIIHWLPSPYLTKAFFLSMPFYVFNQIGYASYRKEHYTKLSAGAIGVSLIVLVLVLLTAKWR